MTDLARILDELDKARRALAEVEIAELEARHKSLRERLLGGDSVTNASRWAEIDAGAFTADKARKLCDVKRLEDLRDMHFYGG